MIFSGRLDSVGRLQTRRRYILLSQYSEPHRYGVSYPDLLATPRLLLPVAKFRTGGWHGSRWLGQCLVRAFLKSWTKSYHGDHIRQ